MDAILRWAVFLGTAISFFGYRFLTLYYELFGLRLQDLPLPAEHYLLRGIDITLGHLVIFLPFLVMAFCVYAAYQPFALQIRARSLNRFVILIPVFLVALLQAYTAMPGVAAKMAKRDIFAQSSALRQLVCVRTDNSVVSDWFTQARADGATWLILLLARNEAIVFRAPAPIPGVDALPRVRVTILRLTQGEVLTHAIAATRLDADDRAACGG